MTESRVSHFESLEQEAHAVRLGMWIFLASEVLLFAAFFCLFAAYHARYSEAFGYGVAHDDKVKGTVNTLVLISSSYAAAMAVVAAREGRRKKATALLGVTVLAGAVFLLLKGLEYASHIREGIVLGGGGAFFAAHHLEGLAAFVNLYFLMTGLHGIHVIVGMSVLAVIAMRTWRGSLDPPNVHPVAVGVLYWHLVDVIWIFLWPLFYLLPGGPR